MTRRRYRLISRLGGELSVGFRERFDVSRIPETWKCPSSESVLELLNLEPALAFERSEAVERLERLERASFA